LKNNFEIQYFFDTFNTTWEPCFTSNRSASVTHMASSSGDAFLTLPLSYALCCVQNLDKGTFKTSFKT